MAVLRHLLRLLAGPMVAGLLAGVVAAEQVDERDVKAAFLFNFTRFVEWPASAAEDSGPFHLCVLSDSTTAEAIERTMKGEVVNGRPVQTVVPRSPEDARRCQILFVGHSEMDRAAPLLAAVRDLPILTVGEGEQYVSRGGTIQFVREGGRVRFDVDVHGAKRVGLTISSRLLRVARHISEPRG